MRYALILAGGSGTRLWPWSRAALPKQLLPLVRGQSLLELAYDRLEQLVPAERRLVCASQRHEELIVRSLGLAPRQYLGEPTGRDTAAAIGFCAAVLHRADADAVMAVCTSDHLIEPVDRFREIFDQGFTLAEERPRALVTFGITPTAASTAYGYLQLGDAVASEARVVTTFREKPDAATATSFLAAGPDRYLWNSGMFVWRAATLLDCLECYEPELHAGLQRIAAAWDGPRAQQTLTEVYPTLKKISIDFAVMERAAADPQVEVLGLPMRLDWTDIGSWNAFASVCPHDAEGNALGAERHVLHNTARTLVASSDPGHLIATVGCEDLLIIHTPEATLVCRADQAERIKELHARIAQQGEELL